MGIRAAARGKAQQTTPAMPLGAVTQNLDYDFRVACDVTPSLGKSFKAHSCSSSSDGASGGNWVASDRDTALELLQHCLALCAACEQCSYVMPSTRPARRCMWSSHCNRTRPLAARPLPAMHHRVRDGTGALLLSSNLLVDLQQAAAPAAGAKVSDLTSVDKTRTSTLSSQPLPSLEFVPAVYKEWGQYSTASFMAVPNVTFGGFSSPPAWLPFVLPNATLYQRLSPSDSRSYLPNVGLETLTFLHHVVHRYNDLAALTVFAQADLSLSQALGLRCLRSNATWAPVSSSIAPMYFQHGQCGFWRNKSAARACFERYIGIFGLQWPESPPGCPSFYIQNAFVVSAATIRRLPHATWRAAYERALGSPECYVDGTGGERSSNAIFGGQSLGLHAWGDREWCQQYRPHCAHSPCRGGEAPALGSRGNKGLQFHAGYT